MKKEQPLVSFILTTYNLPLPMLCECIESILSLSLRRSEREIIIVDDGSAVSPVNDLMKYGDDIIYIRQNNQGVSVARNTGMQMATGKYVQFIDGDDTLLTATYERCLDVIRFQQDAEVVAFDFTDDVNNRPTVCEFEKSSGTALLRNRNIRGSACCYLFRQSVRSALEFTPGRRYAEDEEFVVHLLLRTEVLFITDTPAYFYRPRTDSAVHQTDAADIQCRLDDTHTVILSLYQQLDKLPVDSQLALERRIAQMSMDYLYNIIRLTRSSEALNQRIATLRQEGLFPLPQREYTQKYKWFCKMISTQLGRSILLHTLPYLKPER